MKGVSKRQKRAHKKEDHPSTEVAAIPAYVPSIFDRDIFSSSWDWPLSIWSEFRPLEEELDRKFRHFEDMMEKYRSGMDFILNHTIDILDDFKRT